MNVLVAYGSKRGGTSGIAAQVADGLRAAGFTVDLRDATNAKHVTSYDAVIVGGALYAHRWHRAARRFVERHASELSERPVWFFSSGPLDGSARAAELPPTHQVAQLADWVGARGHTTFGGRLMPDAKGLMARVLAQKFSGDWRDREQIAAWTRSIIEQLEDASTLRTVQPAGVRAVPRQSRRLLGALELFVGLTAIAGGLVLVLSPDGAAMRMPLSLLEHSPFRSFLVPGLLLLGVVGLGNLLAGLYEWAGRRWAELGSFAAGAALVIWIVTQMAMLRSTHWLQLLYLSLGLLMCALSLSLRHLRGSLALHAPNTRGRAHLKERR